MEKSFQLRVVTAEGSVLDERVCYCDLMTAEGPLGVLANHAPMLCALTEGKLRYRREDGSEHSLEHSPGVARVKKNLVTVLADRAKTLD